MDVYVSPTLFALAAFAGMLLMLDLGRRIGLKRQALGEDHGKAGLGTMQGIIFGLTTLVLAFSFSGAMSRYDARRDLVLAEANAIGTAYLRIDLLPGADQPALRDLFRRYVDSRLAVYHALPDLVEARAQLERSKGLQNEIWAASMSSIQRASPGTPTMLVVAALNDMIDLTATRTVAAMSHPPVVIFAMIFVLLLASALVAGQDSAASAVKSLRRYGSLALVLSLTVFVILEIEFPRMGFIRIEAYDQLLVDVRTDMR